MIDMGTIRADFPILKKKIYGNPLVYLDNAATTQKPFQVIEALTEFYSGQNSNIHRGVHYLSELATDAYESARETVRKFIRAEQPSEIIFTQGTTDSINLLAGSLGRTFIKEGNEIIITEMEHHSNLVPWQMLCEHKGAVLKIIPIRDDGTLITEKLKTLMTERTKLISLSWVSNVLGIRYPVEQIIQIAHKHNIPVLIDGAQAVQHIPIDVQSLDCDFLVFSGHKMYAGTGVGILYINKKWLDTLPPSRYGGGMISSVSFEKTTFGDPPYNFEAGTPNIAGAVSLKAAIEYMNTIGSKNIAALENKVYNYARGILEKFPGVTVYGKAEDMCGALSFNLDGIHPYDAGSILDKMGIAVRTGKHCAEPLMDHYGIQGTIRASFAVYNTRKEIDLLIQGIEKVQKMLGKK
ncbi:MAG: cysteine desulfurase [bacterium]